MDYGPWDSFREQEPSEPQAQGPWDQFAKPQTAAPWEQFATKKPEPTESGGFGGSYFESLKDRFATAKPTAKLFTGIGDQKEATDELLRHQEESGQAYKQTEFSDIGKLFKEGHYGDALSKTVDKFKEVAGASLGSMTPAIAAGEAAGLVAGPLAGVAAFGVVSLGSYIADGIARQKQEQEKKGEKYADIDRLSATVAGAGETALDILGGKIFKPVGMLMGIVGKESAEKAAMEIVHAATHPKAYRNAVLKGTAEGIAFEVPQEVAQQVLERWQAGLPLNPFTDPEAAKEYGEAAGGALLLGGPMGGGSKVVQTYQARQTPEGQALLNPATEGSAYDTLSREIQDTGDLGGRGAGAGVQMVDQPGEESAPGETLRTDGKTLAGAGQPAPVSTERKGIQPAALTENLADLRESYNELRNEALQYMGKGVTTPEMTNKLRLIQRDLDQLVDAYSGLIQDPKLVQQLKNPVFNGNRALQDIELANEQAPAAPLGAPPAQRELVPTAQSTFTHARVASIAAGKDPQAAIEYLRGFINRLHERTDPNNITNEVAMRVAGRYGVKPGQVDAAMVQQYLNDYQADIEQTIANLERRKAPKGAPPSQPDLFSQPREEGPDEFGAAPRAEKIAEPVDTTPIEGPRREERVGPPTLEESEMPPGLTDAQIRDDRNAKFDNEVDHTVGTEEGRTVQQFFGSLKTASSSPEEQAKHEALAKNAARALVQYDIARPGERTTSGLQFIKELLSSYFGGPDRLNQLLTTGQTLDSMSAGEQSRLFKKMGLPDLTTRRGLEDFYHDMQIDMEGRPEGSKIPTKSATAAALPISKATLPHTEEFTTQVGELREHKGVTQGEPRRSEIVYKKIQHVLSDTKLRRALKVLREKIQLRKDVTKEDIAAKTYLDRRTNAAEALRAVAFDLAMYTVDPKYYGANSNFMGEGGKYAEDFRSWIEKNLDKNTVDLLNELIAEETQTAKAQEQYAEVEAKRQVEKDKMAEQRRVQAEKNTNVKIPKAPRVKRKRPFVEPGRITKAVGETEAVDTETVEELPLHVPRVQDIYSVHPDIRNAIEQGDTNKALKIMVQAKGNPYYSALAQRLLDANITAKIDFIESSSLEPLNQYDKEVVNSLNRQLGTLRMIVTAIVPKEKQAEFFAAFKSDDRNRVLNAIERLGVDYQSQLSESEYQTVSNVAKFALSNFNWQGKYDPNTDRIVFRRDEPISNHVFLHEVLHAATYTLLDAPQKLKGIQLQGYNQLNELYEHTKAMLSNSTLTPTTEYGLKDLHEFVSEALTNPDFQATLRAIGYKATPHSLYSRFIHSIRHMFGIADREGDSNVLNEVIRASDTLIATPKIGKANVDTGYLSVAEKPGEAPVPQMKLPLGAPPKRLPPGRVNSPTAVNNLLKSRSWNDVKKNWSTAYASMFADVRPYALGALTLRQIADLVNRRIPQLDNFIRQTENFLARKSEILKESGDIAKRWERLQARDPQMSRDLAAVMHRATINEIDPDPTSKNSTIAQRNSDPELMNMWKVLDPEAKAIYREVRDFYDRRYSEYRSTLNKRLIAMRKFGVSDQTIADIRAEFEKSRRKGPYFPLMRHGRFWYQVGKGANREYYMFESLGELEAHLDANPRRDEISGRGDQYQQQQDTHAQQSQFLKSAFDAIDKSNSLDKQELKDSLYQSWLANQPESSFRNQFMHRQKVAGYSEDALRNFAKSSFHMAYQMSRFEHAPDMFSQLQAAKLQVKDRIDAADPNNKKTARENNELSDYVKEMEERLGLMLNPTDTGTLPSLLSNIGFIWYLTAPASAITNVVGGMMIGLPTLIGQQVKLNPNMSYAKATLNALGQMKTVAGQIMRTGFQLEKGARIKDYMLHFPTLDRSTALSDIDKAAYKLFVADGLIDITAAYDQSGLAAAPTEQYSGTRHRVMQALSSLFHNTERFNREVVAMSAFRAAMDKRANYADKRKAFEESIAEAKDVTNRSMFDYSSPNKPRYFQHPVARIVTQFKQFPQQMTFFLVHNFVNMFKGASPEIKREATARFVGTMGMAAIFSGATGIWGFSTLASIVDAVINGLDDDRDEPFDFELEFTNWAVETFGKDLGIFLARGAGNAAGIDLHDRVQLNDMWFRDPRKNQDEVEALRSRLIDLLGPTVGLGLNVAQASKLWNEGHGDRALEMVMPSIVKQPMIAARYAREGVNTLAGDAIVEEVGPFDLLMQSLGIRPSEISERQYYNITKKGQEQAIMKERQNLLNLYGISFMSGDADTNEKALDKIIKFSEKHPEVAINASAIQRSIKERLTKSAMTDHGLYVDKRMMGLLDESYLED